MHTLRGELRLDRRHHGAEIPRYNITAVDDTVCNASTVARVTLDHDGVGFTDNQSNFGNRELLVEALLRREDLCVAAQHEVKAQVGRAAKFG